MSTGADERNYRNNLLAMYGEWAVARWLRVPLPELQEHDEGVDLVSSAGHRINVKASSPKYPELMVPKVDAWKLKRVDILVKATVAVSQGVPQVVVVSCWQTAPVFAAEHRTDRAYPLPTMYQDPGDGTSGTAHAVEGVAFRPSFAECNALRERLEAQLSNASTWNNWRVF